MESPKSHVRAVFGDPVLCALGLLMIGLFVQIAPELGDYQTGVLVAGLLLGTWAVASFARSMWAVGGLLAWGLLLLGSAAVGSGLGFTAITLAISLLALILIGGTLPAASEPGHSPLNAPSPLPLVDVGMADAEAALVDDEESEEEAEEVPGVLLQSWERRRLDSGSELVSGQVRVQFAAGERLQMVHIPLHPPLTGHCHIWLEPVDGEQVSVSEDVLRPYGVRFIVRRQGPVDAATAAVVAVTVTNESQSRAA